MATCPKGHESATADYCDVCGAPMAAGPRPASGPAAPSGSGPAGPATPPGSGGARSAGAGSNGGASDGAGSNGGASAGSGTPCPVCGTPRTGRFCEEDGYDFVLAPAVPDAGTSGGPLPGAGAGSGPAGAGADPAGGPPAAGTAWQVVVSADQTYFEAVRRLGGEDAGGLAFPRFVPERRFVLAGAQVLIGRHSRSRGVAPEIDLAGPPEDPGVSHTHALLVPHEQGWAVVDLESANGTYHNDPESSPLAAHQPRPLADGDRLYVGAWTRLVVRVTGGQG